MDPDTMVSLLASIGQACPNLSCLCITDIDHFGVDSLLAMLTAIGQHFPRIVELQLDMDEAARLLDKWDFNMAGVDWAACLPRGLQKFRTSVNLHSDLLQQLVQLPSLAEVVVGRMGEGAAEVQSGGWRTLRTECFPSYKSLGRFSTAMPLLHLYSDAAAHWDLDATSQTEGPAVAKAAAWLSQISNCPRELFLSCGRGLPDAATGAGIITALGPLSDLVSLQLDHWSVSERTLDELAGVLPNISKSCSICIGLWLRRSRLLSPSLTDQLLLSRDTISSSILLARLIARPRAISGPMTPPTFEDGSALSQAERAGWGAFKQALEEHRWNRGQPRITVHIIVIKPVTLRG